MVHRYHADIDLDQLLGVLDQRTSDFAGDAVAHLLADIDGFGMNPDWELAVDASKPDSGEDGLGNKAGNYVGGSVPELGLVVHQKV